MTYTRLPVHQRYIQNSSSYSLLTILLLEIESKVCILFKCSLLQMCSFPSILITTYIQVRIKCRRSLLKYATRYTVGVKIWKHVLHIIFFFFEGWIHHVYSHWKKISMTLMSLKKTTLQRKTFFTPYSHTEDTEIVFETFSRIPISNQQWQVSTLMSITECYISFKNQGKLANMLGNITHDCLSGSEVVTENINQKC